MIMTIIIITTTIIIKIMIIIIKIMIIMPVVLKFRVGVRRGIAVSHG